MLNLDRLDEADAVLAEVEKRVPGNFGVALLYATLPGRRRRWMDVVQRLRNVVERFPQQPEGYAQLAQTLQSADRKEEAKFVLSQAEARFPASAPIAMERARLAEPDLPAAAQSWRKVVAMYPDEPDGYAGLGNVLRRMAAREEAERRLAPVQERFSKSFHDRLRIRGARQRSRGLG